MPVRVRLLRRAAVLGAVLAASAVATSTAAANGVPFAKGDVLTDVGHGIIQHYSPTGALLDTLDTTTGTNEGDGMCFDSSGNLYATQGFIANTISKFDQNGNLLAAEFGSGFSEHPESCVVDAADNIYVGQPDGSANVLKFDSTGKQLASFAPPTEGRGTDWVDLGPDQCTLHYTSEAGTIKAFNVCTNEALPDFATGLQGPCYAHRMIAGGGELVACTSRVLRLDGEGHVVQTYEPEVDGFLFALNLDSDGTSFWTAGYFTGKIYRIDITTGEVLTSFTAARLSVLGGVAVVGEATCGEAQITLAPASSEQPVGTAHAVTATAKECGVVQEGVQVSFAVSGANAQTGSSTTNAAGQATFTYTGQKQGTDGITARFENKRHDVETSNQVAAVWTKAATPAQAPTAPTPTTSVLAAKAAVPPQGSARAASIRGCIAQSGYIASVRGTSIASVTFTLDGRAIKTLRKSTSGSTFSVRVNVRSGAAHHLAMRVAFTAASKTPTATFRRTLARCAARKVVIPRFTG